MLVLKAQLYDIKRKQKLERQCVDWNKRLCAVKADSFLFSTGLAKLSWKYMVVAIFPHKLGKIITS